MTTTRKEFTAHVIDNVRTIDDSRGVSLVVSSGHTLLALSMRHEDEDAGVIVALTPMQALQLVYELTQRAHEITQNMIDDRTDRGGHA